MDPDDEIDTDWPPYFRLYKSGRVERLIGTSFAPPSSDPAAGVASKDVTIDPSTPISARLYLPSPPPPGGKKLPVLVYFHGGGFCVESASSPTYQPFLSSLSSSAPLLAVSVDYRLAPEHKLPAAYDDAWAALEWLLSPRADPWIATHGDLARVFLAGDSAGANIAHHMAMRAVGIELEGVVLIHPCFWGSAEAETADPAVWAWMGELWRHVGPPGAGGVDHPWLNPTAEGVPSLAGMGCRRVMVCVAERCPMTGRARAYCEALRGSGWRGEVEVFESEGVGHVFHLDAPESEKAAEVVERVAAFVRKGGVA